jgi:UDP-N-acetylmuramoylalanine--D-glutamate ligase
MKVAILGYGVEGQSAFTYWSKPDNTLTICDENPGTTVPDGTATQLGHDYLKNLEKFDLLVRSPGLRPQKILEANPEHPEIADKITSVSNEFYRVCPTKNIIGVTGTKGKGTTSTLTSEFLKAAGKTVHLGGNIGVPALDLLKNDIKFSDWVVLEQSSFQLIDQKYSPPTAVCLMIVPEHLDWHSDMVDYLTAKQNLFKHQTATDTVVYNRANQLSGQVVLASPGQKISYEVPAPDADPTQKTGVYVLGNQIYVEDIPVVQVADVALLGRHNLQNVCAAIGAVWSIIDGNTAAIQKVLKEFKGLEHRLEFVRELNGVKYYDDSFGTTPETATVAVQAFAQPKVLILGGSDKKASFDELAQAVVSGNVRSVISIGEVAPQIETALKTVGYTNIVPGGTTMAEIVATAQKQAQPGDVVLLSTACASFDLFRNYKDRGQQFQASVTALQ